MLLLGNPSIARLPANGRIVSSAFLRSPEMPAYVLSDVTVTDLKAFAEYRSRATAAVETYGGRYLARGGEIEILEGDRRPTAMVLVEFPDLDSARRWYASPEYAEALRFRDDALQRHLILLDGVAQPFPA